MDSINHIYISKKEIKEFLSACRQTINIFIETYKDDVEIIEQFDINKDMSYIKIIDSWLESIYNDIDSNLIPDSFYENLKNDIEKNIPVLINIPLKKEKKHFIYKIVSNRLPRIYKLIEVYSFYKALGFARNNTVLVGANGCGKTALANLIQQTLNIQNGIVIPAQKLLIFPTFASTPNYSSAYSSFTKYQKNIFSHKVTFDAKEMDDVDLTLIKKYGTEMVKVIGMLLGQRQLAINQASTRYKNGEQVPIEDFRGILDDIIDIWNYLIEHRTLFCNDNNQLQIKYRDNTYDAHQMSDGERIIIYLAGRVLYAPKGGIIIVDEPELHLHKSIANKLWDFLESKRPDCKFIYFTHDLDFATSRNCQKGWIRNFTYPDSWNIELISENEIPEDLLLKLLGSRKPVLFCEGKRGSLDRQIFEILFPEYTITPVQSCKDVINFTRAFNKIPNKYVEAYGIIDRDFRTEVQLSKLLDNNVYSYDVAEVENLFMIKEFIIGFANYKREVCNFDDIQAKVIESLNQNKEQQVSSYLSQYINHLLKEGEHLKNGKTKDEVKDSLRHLSKIDIDGYYNERMSYLNSIIDAKDYSQVIRVYNNKGIHSIIEKSLRISSYNHKALQYLKEAQEAQELLRSYFPANL